MKKLKRAAEKFGTLELFADMAAEHGYDLNDPMAQDDFISRVRSSIESGKKSNTTIFGKRIESLFAYVAGALGKVTLLKQEDSGDLYFAGEEVLAPDYRLTFDDRKQILIEVKNCHLTNPKRKFSIKKDYYDKLKLYSELNGMELRFAVFFSGWNLWTLLSIQSFEASEKSYSIDMVRALAHSEMERLGDCMIGTTPDLQLHLLANPDEASSISSAGSTSFVTRDVKLFCAGNEIIDEEEKKIAFYLIQFGTWHEKEATPIISDEKLLGIKFVFSPESQEEPNFAIIGNLSTMITNGFTRQTVKNGDVIALKLGVDPSSFGILIPPDYKGKNLPLWRFTIQPNPNFTTVEARDSV